MGWEHCQTVDASSPMQKRVSPWLVGDCLVSIYSILHFKSQSVFQIHQIFKVFMEVFLNLTYPLRKYLYPNMPKNHPKNLHKTPKHWPVNEISRGILRALLETGKGYWREGHVRGRQNRVCVYPNLNDYFLSNSLTRD